MRDFSCILHKISVLPKKWPVTTVQSLGPRLEIVMAGHHKILESDVVRSAAISNRFAALIEGLVCFRNTEALRPWNSYAGSFRGELLFGRSVPSRLWSAMVQGWIKYS